MFVVCIWDDEWLHKGYMCRYSEIVLTTEKEANIYLENWYKSNKGYGKIKSHVCKPEKEMSPIQFPLKVRHDLPVYVCRK